MSYPALRPGDTWNEQFEVVNASNVPTAPDSLPTARMYKNGVYDSGVSFTVAQLDSATGRYKISCTVPSGYAAGDRIQVIVLATISSVNYEQVFDVIQLVQWPTTALANAAAGASGGAATLDANLLVGSNQKRLNGVTVPDDGAGHATWAQRTIVGSSSTQTSLVFGVAVTVFRGQWLSHPNLGAAQVAATVVAGTAVTLAGAGLSDTPVATDIVTFYTLITPLAGSDGKASITTDAQDLSGTLSVNANKLGGQSLSVGGTVTIAAGTLASSAQAATLQTSINNINNLSALASLIGPGVMEIPASSSIAYRFTLLVKTVEGLLEDLTATPTVAAINTAGTDRSANLSIVTHTGTGVYDFNYTMQSTAAQEGLRVQATGATASDGTSRIAVFDTSAVSVDQGAAIAAIKAKTDTIGTNAGDSPNAATAQGNAATAATQATGANAAAGALPNAAAIATAVRDVNNTSPAANSLGAKVNTAAAGGGGGGTTENVTVEITNTTTSNG